MTTNPTPKSKQSAPKDVPLVVDFDGTLHRSDLTWEALAWAARHDWWLLGMALWTYARNGRAACKLLLEDHLLGHWQPDLPLDERMLELMRKAQTEGRRVVVATGSPQRLVMQVLEPHRLDVEVWGTVNNNINLTARSKAEALVKTFGEKGFDYAGNSRADQPVWRVARKAWVINAGNGVTRRVMAMGNHEHVVPKTLRARWALLQGMRPVRWLKNLLVLVPLLAAHQWFNWPLLAQAMVAIAALSLTSSGVYLLNDVVDVADDRRSAQRRNRPLAAGYLPIGMALAASPLLLVAGLLVAARLDGLLPVVVAYMLLALAYSLVFKRWLTLDVVALALLDVLRLAAGAVATGIGISAWLVAAAFLLFYSLATMQRYVAACDADASARPSLRSYGVGDAPLLLAQGVGSGLLVVMLSLMYSQSQDAAILYSRPAWLALFSMLLLWWISRLWLLAHRGMVDDEPLVVALKDPVSWLAAVLMVAALVFAI